MNYTSKSVMRIEKQNVSSFRLTRFRERTSSIFSFAEYVTFGCYLETHHTW